MRNSWHSTFRRRSGSTKSWRKCKKSQSQRFCHQVWSLFLSPTKTRQFMLCLAFPVMFRLIIKRELDDIVISASELSEMLPDSQRRKSISSKTVKLDHLTEAAIIDDMFPFPDIDKDSSGKLLENKMKLWRSFFGLSDLMTVDNTANLHKIRDVTSLATSQTSAHLYCISMSLYIWSTPIV